MSDSERDVVDLPEYDYKPAIIKGAEIGAVLFLAR